MVSVTKLLIPNLASSSSFNACGRAIMVKQFTIVVWLPLGLALICRAATKMRGCLRRVAPMGRIL
jgi:hypothetical protein